MEIDIINLRTDHPLPAYATECSAGCDLRANLTEPVTLLPLQRMAIPCGIKIALPKGFEAQIRPRSGLAVKHGIGMVNAPGTIDADYRGEIHAVLVNLSNEPFTINDGERVAQMVIAKYSKVMFNPVDTLDDTERGEGGFGHSGRK